MGENNPFFSNQKIPELIDEAVSATSLQLEDIKRRLRILFLSQDDLLDISISEQMVKITSPGSELHNYHTERLRALRG